MLKWLEGQAHQDLHIGQGDLVEIHVAHIEYGKLTCDRVQISMQSPRSQNGQV